MKEFLELKEEELEFCESFFTPRCLVESLFHNFDSLGNFDKDKFGSVRLYQFPLLSDEAIIDFEATAKYHNLSKKEEFRLRKNVGDLYCFGARKFGKTLLVEKIDLVVSKLTSVFRGAFASVDLIHIREVLDDVKNAFINHPICKLWKERITGAPDYKFILKNGYRLNSVNFNVGSKAPGRQWYGKHVDRVYIEEGSLETEIVEQKRKDALSELGAVFRVSGMTNFTKISPAGKSFYNPRNRKHVLNLPQFINPFFDEEEKEERLKDYGGEDSFGYRVFVKGEVVEDGTTTFDMSRVSKNYNDKKRIKRFEITKDKFPFFQNLIVVERPKNAERIFIDADIGERVTEILIHSELKGKYFYIYNIVLYNLTHLQQLEIFKYIIPKVKANVIGLDCGDGMGRAIYRELEKFVPKDNLVWYDGSMKINVGFETDEQGNALLDKTGHPIFKQEKMAEFSVKRLKDLFYELRCPMPIDYKFHTQFSVVMTLISGTSVRYKCVSPSGNHLFDAWKVFSTSQWLKYDFNKTKPIIKTNFYRGGVW